MLTDSISKRMSKYLLRLLTPLLLFWSGLTYAQDFEFQNSIYGIDISILDRFQIELGSSNVFRISINGHEFDAKIENAIEKTCLIPASSYSFDFKDGESYRFIFSYTHKQKGLVHVDTRVTYRKPKLFSLCVGVNDSSLQLPEAQRSAARMKEHTTKEWFFPQYGRGHSFLISTGTQTPSAQNIEKKLVNIRDEVKDGDVFLFYYAGHGIYADGSYSFVLGNNNLYSGISFARLLKSFPEKSEKVVIVCSCYSRQLWQHLYDIIPNVTFFYASDTDVQGDIYAKQLMSLLDKASKEEMRLSDFGSHLAKTVPGSGSFPLQNPKDYLVSTSPVRTSTVAASKDSNLAPAFLSIIPGAGQFYKRDYLKGALLSGTAVASGIGIALCETRRAKYAAQMSQTYDVQALSELSNRVRGYSTGRTVCIVVASAAIVYSIVDAAVAPKKRKVQVTPSGLVYNF